MTQITSPRARAPFQGHPHHTQISSFTTTEATDMKAAKETGAKFQLTAATLYTEAQVYRALAWPVEQQATVKRAQTTHERHLHLPGILRLRDSVTLHFPGR